MKTLNRAAKQPVLRISRVMRPHVGTKTTVREPTRYLYCQSCLHPCRNPQELAAHLLHNDRCIATYLSHKERTSVQIKGPRIIVDSLHLLVQGRHCKSRLLGINLAAHLLVIDFFGSVERAQEFVAAHISPNLKLYVVNSAQA